MLATVPSSTSQWSVPLPISKRPDPLMILYLPFPLGDILPLRPVRLDQLASHAEVVSYTPLTGSLRLSGAAATRVHPTNCPSVRRVIRIVREKVGW